MLEAVLAGLFGLLIGSFLNVCIYRHPRDLSVVRPRSFCPECRRTIAWFDNIPVVSYLVLRGCCRHCGSRIPARYPVVEILTSALFFSFVLILGPTLVAAKFCVFSALLLALVFADLETRILPDEFTLGGAVLGLVWAWFVPVEDVTGHVLLAVFGAQWSSGAASVIESALGALVPAGFLWLGGVLFEKVRHKQGLGFGDVKMIAMIGAFLGLSQALLTLIVGSLLGSIVGLAFIVGSGKDAGTYELPLGTFLGGGALGVCLFGQKVIEWYTGLL